MAKKEVPVEAPAPGKVLKFDNLEPTGAPRLRSPDPKSGVENSVVVSVAPKQNGMIWDLGLVVLSLKLQPTGQGKKYGTINLPLWTGLICLQMELSLIGQRILYGFLEIV